ncbi:MAG: acetylxylan esterase, partial [Bacteroidales bacterium]|nr:acetylxylan esterase [Bacteroidales bacterium]
MKLMKTLFVSVLACAFLMSSSHAQEFEPNYDESKVPDYELPDPLTFSDGSKVNTPSEWEERRKEILRLFENHVYGKMPGKPENLTFEERKNIPSVLDGLATLKEIRIHVKQNNHKHHFDLLLFIPNKPKKPVPVFLGLNFDGNQSVHPNKNITITDSWLRNDEDCKIYNHKATEGSRGCSRTRWPVERILDRGYALATIYYGEFDPDFDDGYQNGVHPLFDKKYRDTEQGNNCASIGAWAWGLSRGADYLAQDPAINNEKMAVLGHSRLGKTALWAGATDQRFDIVISNCSGCGGAALSRRQFGETVGRINSSFPHWFCENFKKYNQNEEELPVDQHMLMALMAPRPVIAASAKQDQWADPKGEFLSVKHAAPV